ncbi:hypothetical protein C8F01DRAFT_46413 [Mycena amicta]|nr:hypothetical protein C8F01DRAFT_46413 [Mycena amicta]
MTQPNGQSERFNASDADVVFRSSDSVLFRIHRKNLEVCTEAFPPDDISTDDDAVELTKTSTTLELLFQFIYPQRHPALDTTPFEVLYPLAEAAEKYQVFPAMNICHIRLRDMVNEHPAEIVVYAAKHDYPYLVSHIAPMMISMPPIQVIEILPPHLILPWTKYVNEWTKVLKFATSTYSFNHESTNNCLDFFRRQCHCLSRLGAGVHTLRSLDRIFAPYSAFSLRDCCTRDLKQWREKIEAEVAKIPKFSTFL